MKLLFSKRSPYARKARIVALEKQIALEFIEEDLTKKSSLLIDANPLGKIPVLILDHGQTIVDSPIICEYLDSLNDRPVLIPKSGPERFLVLTRQSLADGVMDTAIAAYMEKSRHPQDFHKEFLKHQEATLARTLEFFDRNMDQFQPLSLAAIAVAAAVGYVRFRLPQLLPGEKYPSLMKWFEEFSKRPSMTATIPGI